MNNSATKYLIPGLLMALASCQKTNTQSNQMVTLHVSEFKTNIPIERAQVDLYGEGSWDIVCWCTPGELLLEGQTDSKGDFKVTQDIYNKASRGIGVSQPKFIPGTVLQTSYISGGGDNTTTQFTLSAIEQIQLHLAEVNPYPGLYYVIFTYKGETNQIISAPDLQYNLGQGITDTTLLLLAYGEQINTFTLKIVDSANHTIANPGPFQINVSRTDSSTVKEIKY